MMDWLTDPLRHIGARIINAIWRLGFILRFFAALLLPVLAGVHYAVPLLCALCALAGQNDKSISNIQKGSVS